MSKKYLIIVLLILFLPFISAAEALPETIGIISEIRADNAMVVFANNTSYTVDASKAKIMSSGRNAKISDLKIGDSLVIIGPISNANISASLIFANVAGQPAPGDTFIGSIEQLTENSFSLRSDNTDGIIQTVNVATGTIFTRGGISSYAVSDLAVGQTVAVTGGKDPDSPDTINASRVEIVVSDTSPKQIIEKETPAPAAEKPSFFARFWNNIKNFFKKIFK